MIFAPRTIVLNPGDTVDDLAWPAKDVRDILPSILDCTPMLTALSLVIVGLPEIRADPSLTVTLLAASPRAITLQVGGGGVGQQPGLSLLLPLSSGHRLEVGIRQPITALAFADTLVPVTVRAPGALLAVAF